MDTLYIDSRMGITSAKLLGALLDTLESPEMFIRRFNDMGFKGVRLERRQEALNGVLGSKVEFIRISSSDDPYADEQDEDAEPRRRGLFSRSEDDDEREKRHRHNKSRRLADVESIIDDLPLSGKVRKRAISVYNRIAEASAKANRRDISELSLTRTGSRDVIAAVVAVCMLMDEMEFDQIIASPVATGTGYAMTYRGRMPIPIPALQNLLDGIPYSSGTEEGEICSLEGAALLVEFADKFSDMPEIVIIKSGAGFGERKYKSGINCTRVFCGRVVETSANSAVTELEASLYDDSAEALKLAGERLREAGATEAFTTSISPLGGGAGLMLKCVCPNECADAVAGEILRNTSAISVRRMSIAAYDSEISFETVATPIGDIEIMKAIGFGVTKIKPVPASVAKAAREHNISLAQAYSAASACIEKI